MGVAQAALQRGFSRSFAATDDEERGQFLVFIDEQTKRHADELHSVWTRVATVLLNLDEFLTRE